MNDQIIQGGIVAIVTGALIFLVQRWFGGLVSKDQCGRYQAVCQAMLRKERAIEYMPKEDIVKNQVHVEKRLDRIEEKLEEFKERHHEDIEELKGKIDTVSQKIVAVDRATITQVVRSVLDEMKKP